MDHDYVITDSDDNIIVSGGAIIKVMTLKMKLTMLLVT